MKRILLSAIILFFTSAYASAQWTTDSTMNTTVRDSNGVLSPLMASLPDGRTYISWYEFNGPNLELHMQLLDENGYLQWAPGGVVVSNYPQTTATYTYDLKTDHEGNAIVAFQDIRLGNLNVVAYKVDPNGNLVWGAAGISLTDSLSQEGIGPAIGITNHNDICIAWTASDSINNKWIACQLISPTGILKWNSNYRVKDPVGILNYSRAELLAYNAYDIQMLYVEENGSFPGVTSTLYTQRIDSSGTNLAAAIKVSTKTIPYFVFPVPVADDNNGFYVAFNSSNPVNTSLNDVYAQHVDSAGNLWSSTGTEAANSTSNAKTTGASCYVSSMGEFWVLLEYYVGANGNSGVNVQKFDATGNVLLGQDGLVVIPTSPDNYIPTTINDAVNGVILSAYYGSFGNNHIIAEKLDYAGAVVWANTNVSLCAVNSNKDDIQSGEFINDNLVFVWYDDRTNAGAFAQNISGNGDLGVLSSVKNILSENNSLFYPNPSDEPVIYFSSDLNSNKMISVTDIQGKEIFFTNLFAVKKEFSLGDCKNISDGIYFVTVRCNDKIEMFKWIKN